MELFATFLTWQEGCAVVVILPKHPFHFKPLCEVYLVPVVRWLLLLWWSGGNTFCPDTFPCLWHEWVSQGSDYGASINKQINMFPSRSHFTQSCLECSGLSILHILPHLAEQLSIGNAEYILKNGAGILVSGCQSFGQQEQLNLSTFQCYSSIPPYKTMHTPPLPSSLCWSENRSNKRVCVHGNGAVSIFSVGKLHWVSPEFEVGGSGSLIIIITQTLGTWLPIQEQNIQCLWSNFVILTFYKPILHFAFLYCAFNYIDTTSLENTQNTWI